MRRDKSNKFGLILIFYKINQLYNSFTVFYFFYNFYFFLVRILIKWSYWSKIIKKSFFFLISFSKFFVLFLCHHCYPLTLLNLNIFCIISFSPVSHFSKCFFIIHWDLIHTLWQVINKFCQVYFYLY